MFIGRVGAVIMAKRRRMLKKKRPEEEELDNYKENDRIDY